MIKYFGKFCFTLLISCFILLDNFSSANTYNIGYPANNESSNTYVLNNGFFKTVVDGQSKNFLKFQYNALRDYGGFFWNNNKLYCFDANNNNSSIDLQGYVLKYGVCNNIYSNCLYPADHYDYYDYDESYIGDFLNNIDSNDKWSPRMGTEGNFLILHDLESNVNIAFGCSNSFNSQVSTGNLIQNYSGFDSLNSSLFGNPPGFISGSDYLNLGEGSIPLLSNESALNYYESRYGWDEKICYVGTDSLNYLYGQSGISFDEGNGLSIFDVYSQLYGSGYELVWVGNWVNTWLLNYEQWFNSRGINAEGVGHPSWLSYYNSGTHLGDLQFDNLTFPFANQPVAFYFMATYIDQNSPYSTMGGSVVSYCNIKINGGSFEDIIDQSDKNNITDYTENHNEHLGLDSDGTERDYGVWLSSGVNIAFSGDVTVKNTLKNFFDEFDKALGSLDVNTNNRILPTWIVSAFIFVVLFKFLRKK